MACEQIQHLKLIYNLKQIIRSYHSKEEAKFFDLEVAYQHPEIKKLLPQFEAKLKKLGGL